MLGSIENVVNKAIVLQTQLNREKTVPQPNLDLVSKNYFETRQSIVETYNTKPEDVDKMVNCLGNFLQNNEKTRYWYEVWKRIDNPKYWEDIYSNFQVDKSFMSMTYSLDFENRSKLINPLIGMLIASKFYDENKPKEAVRSAVVEPPTVPRDPKTEIEQINNDPKTKYVEDIKMAKDRFLDGLYKVVGDGTPLGEYVDIIEHNFVFLGFSSFASAGIYGASDVVVMINGWHDWTIGKRENNNTLITRGQIKMAVSATPFLPGSFAAPILDMFMPVTKKKK